MITFTKVIHMVLAVGMTFLSLAGLYVLLDAEFVAVTQVLIYGGAVSIIMIFGIMMTKHSGGEESFPARKAHNWLLGIGTVLLLGILIYAIQQTPWQSGRFTQGMDNTKEIGLQLFTQHVIPFELMSVLLTVAFIGAIIVAKREEE